MQSKYYLVKRPKGNVVVVIYRNKLDDTYSFINLTKGHICPCRFASVEDALQDLEDKVKSGEVISYQELKLRKDE